MVVVGTLVGTGWSPAAADVTSVSGGAYGYQTFIGLFGGPPSLRGPAGQTGCTTTTTTACTPTVTLPSGGSALPISASDADGAIAQYGPAVIHQSSSESVSTQGTTGPTGSVQSSATANFDQAVQSGPFFADAASSQCTATETGQSGSATLTNASLALSTYPAGHPQEGEPNQVIALPSNPVPNLEYEGTLDHVGDRFRIVFNEQLRTPDAIVVNAFHMYLLGQTAVGEYILGQSRCGVAATSSNAAPVANDDAYATAPGTALTVPAAGVLANDSDPTGDALSARKPKAEPVPTSPPIDCASASLGPCAEPYFFPTEPDNGSVIVNIDGSFTYTPNAGFVGTDTFTYVANDPRGGGDTALVTITVAPPPASSSAVADFDGDGDSDLSVFRPSSGAWYVAGQATSYLGRDGDAPVPADYDGDGDTDRAVFRPANGAWYVAGRPTTYFGRSGDIPVPADYDADGDTDVAVFRPANGGWYRVGQPTVYFGLNGDVPVPGDYDGDGDGDVAVFRPGNGAWYRQGAPAAFFGLGSDIPLPLPHAIRQAFF